MSKIGISIQVLTPEDRPEYRCKSQLQRVQELIEDCCHGLESRQSWETLRRLFNRLAAAKKLSPAGREVFAVLEPFMQKHGLMDPHGVHTAATYAHGYRPARETNDA